MKDHDFEVSDASFEDENRVKEFLGFKSDKEAFIKILLKQKQLF